MVFKDWGPSLFPSHVPHDLQPGQAMRGRSESILKWVV